MTNQPKVLCFSCLCGKRAILLRVMNGEKFTKAQNKEHLDLLNDGRNMEIISLEEARRKELCFENNVLQCTKAVEITYPIQEQQNKEIDKQKF